MWKGGLLMRSVSHATMSCACQTDAPEQTPPQYAKGSDISASKRPARRKGQQLVFSCALMPSAPTTPIQTEQLKRRPLHGFAAYKAAGSAKDGHTVAAAVALCAARLCAEAQLLQLLLLLCSQPGSKTLFPQAKVLLVQAAC